MPQEDYFDRLSKQPHPSASDHTATVTPSTMTQKPTELMLGMLYQSESLYPAFHGIEIALRYSIHEAASQKFGDQYWFKSWLKPNEQGILTEVTDRLNSQK